jgi:hypothetical protein
MPQHPIPTPKVSAIIVRYIGDVISITITDTGRLTIDAFADFIKEFQQTCQPNEILYWVYDFSSTIAGFQSPYGRAKTKEIASWRPDLTSYAAIILKRGFVTQLGQAFMNNVSRTGMYNYICFTEQEALTWLNRQIEQHGHRTDKGDS